MSLKGRACCITVVAFIPIALADDLSLDARAGDRHLTAAPDVRIPQTAKPDADQASSDVLPRVKDLEATKAAVNRDVGSAVSLSVSGSVGEQGYPRWQPISSRSAKSGQ